MDQVIFLSTSPNLKKLSTSGKVRAKLIKIELYNKRAALFSAAAQERNEDTA